MEEAEKMQLNGNMSGRTWQEVGDSQAGVVERTSVSLGETESMKERAKLEGSGCGLKGLLGMKAAEKDSMEFRREAGDGKLIWAPSASTKVSR